MTWGIGWIRHRDVCRWTDAYLRVVIEVPAFGLGFAIQRWGVRLILGWWHLCVHLPGAHAR